MKRPLLAGLCLFATSLACHADIYLIGRGKADGTDLTSVAFLRDERMATLESCEAERRAARTTGFQIFARAQVSTHRGFSSQLQMYCRESDQKVTLLGRHSGISYVYMVEVDSSRFKLTPFETMGQCHAAAGKGNQSSETRYCARSSQALKR